MAHVAAAEGVDALRAEVSAEHTLFIPGQPLRLRFTLINPTDDVVEVPEVLVSGSAVSLPLIVIYGDAANPALLAAQQGTRPEPLRPDKLPSMDAGDQPLRLGPRASVGTEIDLRAAHREMRYAGLHRIEWRPLGGRIGVASFEFRVESRKTAILVTDFGKITFNLMYDKAPRNVENFLELARDRFYENSLFHRIVPNYILQGGKPVGGRGQTRPDGKTIVSEIHDAPMDVGTLAMALRYHPETDSFEPNSASCQFVIGLARLPELDGKFTVIAQASDPESLRTLQALAERPTDAKGQPLQPVAIRGVMLVDVDVPRAQRLELEAR